MSDLAFTQSDLPAQIRLAAMNLLARREHSCGELQQKLSKKFPTESLLIQQAIQRLTEQGLQSDERFVEAFISSRQFRGQGPLRIAQDLKLRQVSRELIEAWLDGKDPQWYELAKEVLQRRFGLCAQLDQKGRAKRQRFLLYRGFNPDQVQGAIRWSVTAAESP